MRSAALALVLLASVAAPAAADVGGADIVSFLNAQRAANGIPAGIVEDPGLSDGCVKHNAYGRRNNTLTHSEDPSAPGYTAAGAQAGGTSVLYEGGPWTATVNPFETAPLHLQQLLAPRIDRMGAAENDGYGCATTLASQKRPAPAADVTYTYPGDGRTGWPVAQTAAEGPYPPGTRVGIPAGTRTGPYLYAMFDGPGLSPGQDASGATATLTGPAGPVDVAVVDNTTDGLQGYLPTGMQVIPRAPLSPMTTYTASVTATVAGRAFAHTWTFETGGAIKGRGYTVGKARARGREVVISVNAQVPVTVRTTLRGAGRRVSVRAIKLPGGASSFTVRVPKALGKRPRLQLSVNVLGTTTKVVRRVRL